LSVFSDLKLEGAFAGPKPWGTVLIFVGSTIAAICGAYLSGYSGSERCWLAAGWLLAAVVVVTVAFNAANADENAKRKDEEFRKKLEFSASVSEELYKARLDLAKAHNQAAVQAPIGPDGDVARSLAEASLADMQLAADRLKLDSGAIYSEPQGVDRGVITATLVMNIVVFIISGFLIVTFWNAIGPRQWASSMMWSASCLVVGGFAGFLFGLPRSQISRQLRNIQSTNQRFTSSSEADSRQSVPVVNEQSPIEQIADWLTKTIVGVGLVNLKQIPGLLHRWAVYISKSLAEAPLNSKTYLAVADFGPGPSFAAGMIIYFSVVGFLGGYLITQMFLQAYINKLSLNP
jgi:hypothetical protein